MNFNFFTLIIKQKNQNNKQNNKVKSSEWSQKNKQNHVKDKKVEFIFHELI